MDMNLTLQLNETGLQTAALDTVGAVQRIGTEVIALGGCVNIHWNNDGGTTPARLTSEKMLDDWMDDFRNR